MLVFQDNSEHWELLQVSQVTSESTVGFNPTGHSLGGLPNISGAPNWKLQHHTEPSIPHKAHHLVICACQALQEETPTSQTLNMRKEVTTSSPHSQHLTSALGREVMAADEALARNQDPVLQPLLLPHWRLGYGVMSPDQTLITLTRKATQPLISLSKAGTYCTVEGAAILAGCLFLPSWHGNKAQVCTWDKGRGHREKK